jgi:hypothetical protein
MPESAHDEEAMEVAGRMGDAPSRGRLGNVSAVAYLSECRHDVYSAGRGKSGERLIYAGDPKGGIAACASCHGPGGYRIGAPALTKQNELYIDHQLHAFAQGTGSKRSFYDNGSYGRSKRRSAFPHLHCSEAVAVACPADNNWTVLISCSTSSEQRLREDR